MAGGSSRFAFKILSAAVAIPVGKLIAKATGKAWTAARPDNPPHNPKEVQTSWADAIIFALITGIGAALAQLVTTKGADTVWRAATGKPSPRPKEPKDNTKADKEVATL
ncbi:DUF4235 domain-containing protein [Jatrophihabitans telluris]|uniref:DUF4235 domain-containing protein n=1 Tax=Jatrophihabitans telluris TaxID=2038343 RepID=A0ABY4R2K2_9ACTN|nr:DUF4235 domain-containing protein [Jatrophihabitans telluris]UQX89386.1 DUF4235 domain-containing protein [Jatrophihabitans telluris]